MKKIVLLIFSSTVIFILNSTKVYALMARYEYNPVATFLSHAMLAAPLILAIIYTIGTIIYYKKSKKDKRSKIKRLEFLL